MSCSDFDNCTWDYRYGRCAHTSTGEAVYLWETILDCDCDFIFEELFFEEENFPRSLFGLEESTDDSTTTNIASKIVEILGLPLPSVEILLLPLVLDLHPRHDLALQNTRCTSWHSIKLHSIEPIIFHFENQLNRVWFAINWNELLIADFMSFQFQLFNHRKRCLTRRPKKSTCNMRVDGTGNWKDVPIAATGCAWISLAWGKSCWQSSKADQSPLWRSTSNGAKRDCCLPPVRSEIRLDVYFACSFFYNKTNRQWHLFVASFHWIECNLFNLIETNARLKFLISGCLKTIPLGEHTYLIQRRKQYTFYKRFPFVLERVRQNRRYYHCAEYRSTKCRTRLIIAKNDQNQRRITQSKEHNHGLNIYDKTGLVFDGAAKGRSVWGKTICSVDWSIRFASCRIYGVHSTVAQRLLLLQALWQRGQNLLAMPEASGETSMSGSGDHRPRWYQGS